MVAGSTWATPRRGGRRQRPSRPSTSSPSPASGSSSAPPICAARGTRDTFFYYLFPELAPATYFMEMDPGIANAEDSPLADEVASADWVLLTNFWAGWREPNTAMEYGSDAPNEVVRTQFCLVESFEDDLVLLYRRC